MIFRLFNVSNFGNEMGRLLSNMSLSEIRLQRPKTRYFCPREITVRQTKNHTYLTPENIGPNETKLSSPHYRLCLPVAGLGHQKPNPSVPASFLSCKLHRQRHATPQASHLIAKFVDVEPFGASCPDLLSPLLPLDPVVVPSLYAFGQAHPGRSASR